MDAPAIISSANPRFKLARALLARRGRQKHALLLLEGVRLIEDAISAGYPPALVLFDQAAGVALTPLLGRAQAAGAEVTSLEASLLHALCETTTPQGVVAVAPWPRIEPNRQGLSLILDGLQDPGNLGTLVRSAAAAGVDQIITLPGVTDPWAPKVLRAGMGAHYRVAIRQGRDGAEVEEWIGGAQRLLATADGGEVYTAVDWTAPSALVIGSEAHGARLTASWPGLRPIAIPMARQVESLNAAVAGSVILFEAARQRRAVSPHV